MTKFHKWHYIKDQTGIYNIGTKLDSCLAQTCDEETARMICDAVNEKHDPDNLLVVWCVDDVLNVAPRLTKQ